MHKDKREIKNNNTVQAHKENNALVSDGVESKETAQEEAKVKEEETNKKSKHKKKYILILEEEYEALKKNTKAKEELQDKILRLQAEFENARKRLEKERLEFIKYASEEIIRGLINIMDDFGRALNASKNTQDFNLLYKGIEMILRELEEFLAKRGLTKIETMGQIFDPSRHEALEIVMDNTKPENTIVEEIQRGYSLNGRVLRVAAVKISKKTNET
ncbi:MAG: nucleotide exchange factor GrpE [Candidatus Omnitrophica bacterium]|nr:nucleotide exchange factor GrpE [Candidatus Omnitrophota bacterium]